jgi:PAS domain S-box-containing protein
MAGAARRDDDHASRTHPRWAAERSPARSVRSSMSEDQRESLRELMRRVDEVRGLSGSSEGRVALDPGDADALRETLGELVQELENSHRRLIETNVQLVSLREVASSMVNTVDAAETTRTVTRYLARAFGFEEVFLLLLDREKERLEGTWMHGGHDRGVALELPVLGERGAITRALWLNRTVALHSPQRHPAALLPQGHPLQETLAGLGAVVSVPLQRSHTLLPAGETHELCGARCIVGDATVLAPPPGPAAETWIADREQRQRHCLNCHCLPMLGVLGVARTGRGEHHAGPFQASEITMLESIALSIAPMVENASLTHELRRSERFREHVLDSMAGALVAVDLRGAVLTFNRAAAELLGFREDEVLGHPFGELVGADGEAALHATLEHGNEALREEVMLRARDGAAVPVSLTTSLLRNEKRAVYGAIATFMDLTPLKRAEERARQLDRLAALGRFTSSVAHEIRNPLTGIAAGVQYLSRGIAPADPQRENLEFILKEIRRLDSIVQDLFDITHPRRLELLARPVEEAVQRAIQCLEALCGTRGVTIAAELTPRTPPVPHDPDQIEQVLINLLKNAVEASPSGATVCVRVAPVPAPAARRASGTSRSGPAPGPPGVRIQVEDEGCGIAPEAQQTLFEPFVTTKPNGTGLGLYISQDIIKRHGGRLAVHSESGRGTTFTVELPLENHGGTP